MKIKFEDIKPIGEFEGTLLHLRKKSDEVIEDKKPEKIFMVIEMVSSISYTLKRQIELGSDCDRDREEVILTLLYSYLIIIDLTNALPSNYSKQQSSLFPTSRHIVLNSPKQKNKEQLVEYISSLDIFKNINIE
jgi:hypothetical protein